MADAPQVAYAGPWPEADHRHQPPALSPEHKWEDASQARHHDVYSPTTKKTVLGLKRRNVWILCLLALILVGAIVGGSVGGVAAVQKKNDGYVQQLQFQSASSVPRIDL
jgi:hypothetical protein